jgi:hypothetical protein
MVVKAFLITLAGLWSLEMYTTCEPVFIVELLSSWLLESEQGVCHHTVALPFTFKKYI